MISINAVIRFVIVIETHLIFREVGTEFLNVRRIADVNLLRLIETVNCLSTVFSDLRKAQKYSPMSTDFIL
jgi:hypothetical protein